MKRTMWPLAGAILMLSACGYIGPPQYPALNLTVPITDLTAVERGDHLDVNFTIPAVTTEGLPVKSIGSVDLRVGPSNNTPFKMEQWAAGATHIEVPAPEKPSVVQTKVPVGGFAGHEVIVGVRIANAKGKFSEWSNLFTVKVTPPLATPVDLAASNVREGVLLKWNAQNQSNFRIYRRAEKETQPTVLAASNRPEYLDTTTVYGKPYEYLVQGVDDKAESEVAGPVSITPVDIFPPAVPSGVTATAGLGAIELAWARNEEPDFQGYRVYRSVGDGPFEQIANNIQAPNYSDHAVQTGKRYRYTITAVDQAGNESQKSAIVEASAP